MGGVAVAVLGLQSVGGLQLLEWAWWDQLLRLQPTELNPNRVTVIGIDEADISRWGYPLSDALLAQTLDKIRRNQPRAIGLDLYRNLPVEPGSQQLQYLFATTPNLIGIQRIVGNTQGAIVEPPPLLAARHQVAASDVVVDSDGKLRRSLLSLRDRQGQVQFTLGTQLALIALAQDGITPHRLQDQMVQLGKGIFRPLQPNDGGYVRADTGGYQILSRFYQPQAGIRIASLTALLQDQIPEDWLRDRVVLLGTTAPSINDRFYTPFSLSPKSTWAGVEVHADVANQLLSAALNGRSSLQGAPVGFTWLWIGVWAIVGGWLGFWLITLQRTVLAVAGMGLLLVGSSYGGFLLGWWITLAAPALALISSAIVCRGTRTWKALQQANQQLADYSRTLEQQVHLRTQELVEQNQALETAKQAAEAANRAKSAFLANMNHELRTPLTIILGCSDLLQYTPHLQPEQRQQLKTIERSVQHLLSLINDVLELSRLEVGAAILRPSRLSLAAFLRGLEDLFRPQCDAKGLTFCSEYAPDLPHQITADENKLRQVLVNLLSNALKFTDRGSITLRVFCRAHHPDTPSPSPFPIGQDTRWLICEVADTGPGIPPEDLTAIFAAFVQGKTGQQSQQGVGLGLAICQQVMHLMGGHLSVTSQVGQGSQFQMEVPVLMHPPPARPARSITTDLTHPPPSPPSLHPLFQDLQRAIAQQPQAWRIQVYEAAQRLSEERCHRLIQAIPIDDRLLAQSLENLLKAFRFDVIAELIQPSSEEMPGSGESPSS